MAGLSFEKRIVSKFIADRLEEELNDLDHLAGTGTLFATLTRLCGLHSDDTGSVIYEMHREMVRQRKRANLPNNWRDAVLKIDPKHVSGKKLN